MKIRITGLILVILLLVANFSPAQAQTYQFQVVRNEVNLFINPDGTATIEYWITFANDPSADPIDYVDIGLPNENYELDSITADVGGQAITDIERSPYVSPGVALGLGANAIQPGQSGEVHARVGVVRNMLHPSTEQESEPYAVFNFMPNYFDDQFVQGNTQVIVTLILPPGMTENEPRYFPPKNWPGDVAPSSGIDAQDRVYYTWETANGSGDGQYTFGASFPARLVPEDTIVAAPAASIRLDDDLSGTLCCIGFGVLFVGIFGLVIYSSIWGARRRKLQYLPPKIAIEGHGIKRGLTSVEAAILLQQPVDKVMTMILFSVVKKGAAIVESREPLRLQITSPRPEGLQPYEVDFLEAMEAGKKPGEQRKALQDVLVNLIKSVTQKMKGFSQKETVAYYEDIMRRAWEQVEAADTPDVKVERFDEYIGWTMLDKRFEDRTREVFTRPAGPIFVPWWWGNYDPVFRSQTGSSPRPVPSPSIPSGGSRTIQLPNLPGSDFAASVTNGIQNFASGVLGDVTSFTSGVTNRTNPPPKPTTSGYRGGGGGGRSCACACACAGCACACAGGGR